MQILYTREENPEEIIIIYRYYAFLLYLLFASLFLVFLPFGTFLSLLGLLLCSTIYTVGFWKPNREVSKAMAVKQQVVVSGKRISLSNPLTFRIKKQTQI